MVHPEQLPLLAEATKLSKKQTVPGRRPLAPPTKKSLFKDPKEFRASISLPRRKHSPTFKTQPLSNHASSSIKDRSSFDIAMDGSVSADLVVANIEFTQPAASTAGLLAQLQAILGQLQMKGGLEVLTKLKTTMLCDGAVMTARRM